MIQTEAQKRWPDFITLIAQTIIPLFIVLIFGIVQMIRFGFYSNDYALLSLGSILAVIAVCTFPMISYVYSATGSKSYLAILITFLQGAIVLFFGGYLLFFRGFWSLMELRYGFEILILIKSVVFVLLGYSFVSNFSKMTYLDRTYLDSAKNNGWI